MEIIVLGENHWEIIVSEGTDGYFDAMMWDNRNRVDSVSESSGVTRDGAIVGLFVACADSRVILPADVFVPFRSLYLECVHRLADKTAKRSKVKL